MQLHNMQFQDKVAIVTGSGQGIGLGIAMALAKEGCNIVITDLNADTCTQATEEIKKLGVKAIGVPCDVAKKDEVDSLVEQTLKEFGKLDILVNNAGVYPYKAFMDMTEADWDKVMNVNMKGVFLCCSAALKHMKEGSKIVNISSIASIVGFENLVHYCASKGGVNGLTRTLAVEMAPKKINVNAVAPGAIETPGTGMTEESKKNFIPMIPWGRVGVSEDIANAVVFLASEGADYITGQVLVVDGGWTLK